MASIASGDAFSYHASKNISSTLTIEKVFMTIPKAQAYALKLPNCVGFSVENKSQPNLSKEYLIHFKEGDGSLQDGSKWHTYLCPDNKSMAVLKPPARANDPSSVPKGGKRASHARTVTNFCKEANIAESDQIDMAEFIVAARYLGTSANDDQLMDVFMDMEDTNRKGKDPKELIKELMKKVDEEYGLIDDDGKGSNDPDNEDYDHEIVMSNPLDGFAEDAIWQEDQIDSFLNQNQQDQNLKIARNLLATTALTRHEIAEITGVEADLLADYDSEDYSTEEEDEEDDADDDDTVEKSVTTSAAAKGVSFSPPKAKDDEPKKKQGDVSAGVTIRATDFSKSVMLTKDDLGTLKGLIDGGTAKVEAASEDALKLLKKLNGAININPKGHAKRTKTLARLKLDKLTSDDKKDNEKEAKLPAKYRVVIHPGALCKGGKELTSKEVCKLAIGTVVTVEEIDGRRARISSPNEGWVSLNASDGRLILERASVKSAAMDKAIHAERARQTKVLILKSITTLNDATVTRILEKSDWNLRRAIEAFYIAKYKTQEYLTKKEQTKAGSEKGAPKDKSKAKKGKSAWWKSWKTFANENK